MICYCIKLAAGNDCCYPHCFQIIHLLRGLKGAYDPRTSMAIGGNCVSCEVGSDTCKDMQDMSFFCTGYYPCWKVPSGTNLPSELELSANYKPTCYIAANYKRARRLSSIYTSQKTPT